MDGKLYIGNLPASASEADLQTKFEQFGKVIAVSIDSDANTGKRNRCAHVVMGSGAEARAAVDRLNMTQYEDTVISVRRVLLHQ